MRPEVKVSRPRTRDGGREDVVITILGCYGESIEITAALIGSDASHEGTGELTLSIHGQDGDRSTAHVILHGDMDADDERTMKATRWGQAVKTNG